MQYTCSTVNYNGYQSEAEVLRNRLSTIENKIIALECSDRQNKEMLDFFHQLKTDIETSELIKQEWDRFMAMYKLASPRAVGEL